MNIIPKEAYWLLLELAPCFSLATFRRFQVLLVAALLNGGRQTVTNLLRMAGGLAPGHSCSYHRFFSDAKWQGLKLACAFCRFLLTCFLPEGVIHLAGDDTVCEHRGKEVYGKARHRDPVRSSHSYTAYRYGHKWVVLCLLVEFPFASRRWALPILVTLYQSQEQNQKRNRPHQTPPELLELLLKVLLRCCPDRRFLLTADGNYATHRLARLAKSRQNQVTFVSRFYADANLYQAPPPRQGKRVGRPRVKGAKLPSPQEVVAAARRTRLSVSWYGGAMRKVQVVSQTDFWHQAGHGLVLVRWVWVHDLTGTHRDEYFFSTDQAMSPKAIIEAYTGRWNIETTFQEARASLGLDTTRGWCQKTVLRAAPLLFGLYSAVAALYALLPTEKQHEGRLVWQGKSDVTFSDALATVRRWLWKECIFANTTQAKAFAKLPPAFQRMLLYALAPAA